MSKFKLNMFSQALDKMRERKKPDADPQTNAGWLFFIGIIIWLGAFNTNNQEAYVIMGGTLILSGVFLNGIHHLSKVIYENGPID